MTELKRMSHSRYEDYMRCGEAYRLKRVERVPTPPMLAGAAGTAFHSWTDNWDDETCHVFVESWKDYLDETVADEEAKSGYDRKDFTVFGKVDYNWYLQHGEEWCQKYIEWRQETGWKVASGLPADPTGNTSGIEYELTFTCGRVEVVARLDRIWEIPDEGDRRASRDGSPLLVITDTKTGSKIKPSEQLIGQVVGCRVNGIPVVGARYYNVRTGAVEKLHTCEHWNVERLRMLYEQTAYAIAEGFFIPRPSGDCFVCTVKKSCLFAI